MLSLNQILTLLEDKKDNHAVLTDGTFLFGDPWEFGASNEITYPLMGVTLNNTNLAGNIHTTSLQIFFCDLVHKDESNEQNVLSDLQTSALEIYSQVKSDLEDYFKATVSNSATLEDFTERFDDEVSGWQLTLNIEQFYDRSTCNLPDSGNNAGKVIIYNADGTVNVILNPNSYYFLPENMTETAETYTVTGTTQSITQTPNFIFGVFLNGQKLTLTTDYTVSGTTITFVTALSSDIVTIVYNY